MPSSYAVGDHFEAFIRAEIDSGRYNNASEVVRAGLRLLEDQEEKRRLWAEEIRRTIEEARAEGVLTAAEDVFDTLEQKYHAMIEHEAH